MPRRLSQTFRCSPLQDLLGQLLRAPATRRSEQILRLEKLHDTLDPARTYPLDFLAFQITGYRPEASEPTLLIGEAAQPDLRLMIDALSHITPDPPAATAEQTANHLRPSALAKRWQISTKTLDRYRRLGLRWRWQANPDGQPRLIYPRQAIEHFEQHHADRLARAAGYAQWTRAQRDAALDRARQIAARCRQPTSLTPNRLAQHLARRTGIPSETLRRALLRAGIPNNHRSSRLTDRDRAIIARAHRRKIDAGRIARRFGRSRASIYRILQTAKVQQLRDLPILHAPSAKPLSDQALKQPDPKPADQALGTPLTHLPHALKPPFSHPAATSTSEQACLTHAHRLRATADARRQQLDPARPKTADIKEIHKLLHRADRCLALVARAQPARLLANVRRQLAVDDNTPVREASRGLLDSLTHGLDELEEALAQYDPFQPVPFDRYLQLRWQRRLAQPATGRARRRTDPETQTEDILARCRALNIMD
ncbi:hypothetical protein [Mucisphaera sp.]|uniref:hypothetical protein n=1 Tax=Mucisphaera sp. TaxID=2913024 RepID=UPI003D0B38A7